MGKFKLTLKAKADLKTVGCYTQKRWGIRQRNKYLASLDARMHWLVENPQLGKKRDDIKSGYLSYQEGRHVIFYRQTDDNIEIIGVLHQRMDFEQHL